MLLPLVCPDESGSIKGLTCLLQDLDWQFSAAGREDIMLSA